MHETRTPHKHRQHQDTRDPAVNAHRHSPKGSALFRAPNELRD